MLRIDALSFGYGPRQLLDHASVSLAAGHRVGVVGHNGAGKSTLFRLIAGELEPHHGVIERPGRWRIGITRQEAPNGEENLLSTVLATDADLALLRAEAETTDDGARIAEIHERLAVLGGHAAEARAARILFGLGFDAAAQARPCRSFSGGWRMRVALAALLFTEPDLLLLDEPTNHLDFEATVWLEGYLARYPGTVLIISHDRTLLNRAVDQILHLDRGKLTLYEGGYDRFEATRRQQLELTEKLRRKQEIQRAHIEAFVARFRYKASKSRQAQSRLKVLAKMAPIAEADAEHSVTIDWPAPDPLSPPILALDGVDAGYGETRVLNRLNLRVDDDDRIALLGANGNGKSTLVKLLAGRLAPMAGELKRSAKLRIGYFAQHQAEELDPAANAIGELSRRRPKDTELAVRTFLGGFGFSKDRAETPTRDLSGGEKARLLLALMASDRPHLLLLDEPTNHLDIETRQALIQAINGFPGAIILVTHDPHMIEATADRLWLVSDGRVTPFDGDLDAYRTQTLGRSEAPRADERLGPGSDRREQRRLAAQRRETQAPLRRDLAKAESELERLDRERQEMERMLLDPAVYGDPTRLVALQRDLSRIKKDLERAEASWLALQETWDQENAAQQSGGNQT
ncbi:MAG: ABC-F family ATP-binding cassette domain-containing protein [Alphaproteobacteria bacterium]|nr:ABC-F family ATP-binding cassette domain-containing protein [Alphaproteobacteria bacterium]